MTFEVIYVVSAFTLFQGRKLKYLVKTKKSKCTSNYNHVYQRQASRKCTVRHIESGCLVRISLLAPKVL